MRVPRKILNSKQLCGELTGSSLAFKTEKPQPSTHSDEAIATKQNQAHRNLSDSSENAISSLFSLKAYISEVPRVWGDFH